jgi:hypothetical protein
MGVIISAEERGRKEFIIKIKKTHSFLERERDDEEEKRHVCLYNFS